MRVEFLIVIATIGCGKVEEGPAGPQGEMGEMGEMGAMGTPGQSVAVTNEPAGSNCVNGGVKLVGVSGTSYVCNGPAGTNGANGTDATAPSGAVVAFAGTTAPTGWHLCDGAALSRATYPSLFAVIGTLHGAGDGTTTFNVPDYRGRFLRGVDGGTGRDPDAGGRTAANPGGSTGDAVGSVETAMYASHSHAITDPGHDHDMTFARDYNTAGPTRYVSYTVGQLNVNTRTLANTTGITINASGGAETRPVNAAVNYIIKM